MSTRIPGVECVRHDKFRVYQYTVEGGGLFPFDMLRHDMCWPHRSEDASNIEFVVSRETRRRVRLHGLCEPTVERWRSFNWSIVRP